MSKEIEAKVEGTLRIFVQGQGVEDTPAGTYPTIEDVLREKGVSLDTPVLVNGKTPTTLGQALGAGDTVLVGKPGEGA